jgi:hypothetical protein
MDPHPHRDPEEEGTRRQKKPRIEFTDAQRAEIFVRDKATCSFSGANLWLLDAPLRPGYERDWVDHVIPAARGGKTTIENGVCASHTFNGKKRNNGADNLYLFEEGYPTSTYYDIFGPLRPDQIKRLQRLAKLIPADWYFNRAIGQILLGFDYRCWLERDGSRPSRSDQYWFGCAWKKLTQFRKTGGTSFETRGIADPNDENAQQWLTLRNTASEEAFHLIVEKIYSSYAANFSAWADYFYDDLENETPGQFLQRIEQSEKVSKELINTIRQDILLKDAGV